MPQLTYSTTQPAGIAGQLADLSVKRVITGTNKSATGAIPFGVAVTKGTNAGEYKVPTVTGDLVHGFVVHTHDVDQRDLSATQGVPANMPMNILTEGVLLVLVEAAVAVDDAVYARWQGGPSGLLRGSLRNTGDANVAWQAATSYALGARKTNDTAKLFECITAGRSAGSGGPTGNGSDITDDGSAHATNTVTCATVQVGDKVIVGGIEFTAIVNGGTPAGHEFALGTGATEDDDTATALAAAITAAAATAGATAAATLHAVLITSSGHAAGNAITLTTTSATRLAVTTAGGKLTGGFDAAHWKFVETVSGATAASANLVKGAIFRTAALAGGLAEVEFSKLVNLS